MVDVRIRSLASFRFHSSAFFTTWYEDSWGVEPGNKVCLKSCDLDGACSDIELIRNNARIGSQIAVELSRLRGHGAAGRSQPLQRKGGSGDRRKRGGRETEKRPVSRLGMGRVHTGFSGSDGKDV